MDVKRPGESGPKRGRARTRTDLGVTRTLDRGLALLEEVARLRTATLTELSRVTDMSASTASRLLETLRARNFVRHDEATGVYSVGLNAFVVGASAVRVSRLDQVATNIMRGLTEATGETASLAVRDGSSVIYVEQVEALTALRMSARLGLRMPLHATAAGKVLMAWTWEGAVDSLLGPGPYDRVTGRTILSRDGLLDELGAVRTRGWALDNEECEPDLRCVAAPVRDRRGDVIAALSISAAAGRMPDTRIASVAEQVRLAALDISARLGWQGAFAQVASDDDSVFMD